MPESVNTGPEISPTLMANLTHRANKDAHSAHTLQQPRCQKRECGRTHAMSSKDFCIWPRVNEPRSPPRPAELQSLYCMAMSSKVAVPSVICLRKPLCTGREAVGQCRRNSARLMRSPCPLTVDDLEGLRLGASDQFFSPRRGPPRLVVLDEDVGAPHFLCTHCPSERDRIRQDAVMRFPTQTTEQLTDLVQCDTCPARPSPDA